MTELSNLDVQHVDRDIIVTMPATGYSVTYRKDTNAPRLVAIDGIDGTNVASKVNFWAQAWKAAHRKARARLVKSVIQFDS